MDFDLDLYYQSAVFPGFGEPTLEETEAATKAALEAELRGMRASFASASGMEHHELFMDPSTAWDFGSNVNANSNNTLSNTTSSTACSTPSLHALDEIIIKSEPTENCSLPPDSPQKKRRQPWGRQLTPPTTNLPPRKRAKTDAEKQQRAYERVIRNRKAAETSRQRKQAQQDQLYRDLQAALDENKALKAKIGAIEKECTTYKTRSTHLQLQLQGISNGSTAMSAAFKVEDPVAPIKLETAGAADHYVSPAALTCESPANQFDDIVSPTSSFAGSPETMSEDESPRTPTELKSGVYSHMFSHYATYPSDSILLPTANAAAEPRKMANAMDISEHFNDVFTALNYDRNPEAAQLTDFVQNLF
ncbi:hypothetical protein TWF225_002687 [Orbilia oligospora]|uniref:Uncharacterized protein n=1 Tax=Orbilia oligospora TaxID=2813651 RepID=A0A7C8P7Q3_ORBOL|nr:hypothetical protein TWF225_002687 [Orbilia oligospora]KAF3162908.1 hypothetical protein TWF751_010517 [Orbilia oligospora]KAF3239184.1 hypothetical protein TWF217_001367 [Orbilia oligospora]KAF3261393.1 hypothetical protein TWF128_003155 [Orbilia oligospora]KAF3282933.1 hypothetical protein TWF132_010563 [Orbilia oligospora]